MQQIISIPEVDGFRRQLPAKRWVVIDHPDAGVGLVTELPHADNDNQAARSAPHIILRKVYVEKGDRVTPKELLAELEVDGMTMSIISSVHGRVEGVVDWKEGEPVQSNKHLMTLIADESMNRITKGLTPRPTTVIRRRRERDLMLGYYRERIVITSRNAGGGAPGKPAPARMAVRTRITAPTMARRPTPGAARSALKFG